MEPTSPPGTLGLHWLARGSGCPVERLADPAVARATLEGLVARLSLTAVSAVQVREHDGSVVAFVLLAESHASVHTEPAANTVFVDVFSCGTFSPEGAAEVVRSHYCPESLRQSLVRRGAGEDILDTAESARGTFTVGEVEAAALGEVLGFDGHWLTHTFEPQGQSWVWTRPGARLVVHTWPEHGLATLDAHGLPEVLRLGGLVSEE